MASVELVVKDAVAWVTLDRPPLNVIDMMMARELAASLEEIDQEDGLAAVVLSGRGRAFCAGVDVRDHLPHRGAEMLNEFHRVCKLLLQLKPPTVAAVNGSALGGGCELILVCDMAWAAENAKMGFPEIRLGVFPPVAAAGLSRLISPKVAAELILTGRTITARKAEELGLINKMVADDQLESAVKQLTENLRGLSPPSLRAAKRAYLQSRPRLIPEEIDRAEELYVKERLNAPDAIEGLTAFLEKRIPVWASRESSDS